MIFELKDIQLDGNKSRVQVCRIGDKMHHKLYGIITITKKDQNEMIENFNSNARGLAESGKPILQFDFQHKDDEKAAGWIHALQLSEDEEQLFADVEWTESGLKSIKAKEFKFVSPLIVRDFLNNDSGKKYPVILKGAALTNIPFLTGMEAISALDEGKREKIIALISEEEEYQEGSGEIESILKAISLLSDEEKAEIITHFKAENPKMEKIKKEKPEDKIELSESEIKLTEDNTKLQEENDKLKKEQEFMTLLSEGKAVPAQKEAFLAGDMVKFVEAGEAVKLDEKGDGATDAKTKETEAKTKEEAEDRIIKLCEDIMEKDSEIPYTVAMKQAYAQDEKLMKLVE